MTLVFRQFWLTFVHLFMFTLLTFVSDERFQPGSRFTVIKINRLRVILNSFKDHGEIWAVFTCHVQPGGWGGGGGKQLPIHSLIITLNDVLTTCKALSQRMSLRHMSSSSNSDLAKTIPITWGQWVRFFCSSKRSFLSCVFKATFHVFSYKDSERCSHNLQSNQSADVSKVHEQLLSFWSCQNNNNNMGPMGEFGYLFIISKISFLSCVFLKSGKMSRKGSCCQHMVCVMK